MKPRPLVLAGCALVLCAVIWFATSDRRQARSPATSSQPPASVMPAQPVPPPSTAGSTTNRPATPPPPTPGEPADQPPPYVAPGLQGEAAAGYADLDKVNLMFRDYRTLFGQNPVGTNAEIMKAMMGGNPRGARLGPPDGLSINSSGELLDRWGTPFFFHQMSGAHMEVRSAGPDRKMWTSDDLILK